MNMLLLLAAGAVGAFALAGNPSKANAKAQVKTPKVRDPRGLLEDLKLSLATGGNFGTAGNPNVQVAQVQRVLMIADDGIVGPQMRASAASFGVQLPPRPGGRIEPEREVYIGDAVLRPAQQQKVAEGKAVVIPSPQKVVATPPAKKGSIAVDVKLESYKFMAAASPRALLKNEVKKNSRRLTDGLKKCGVTNLVSKTPSISVTGSEPGVTFVLKLRWPVLGKPPSGLQACVSRQLKSDSTIGSYVKSVTVRVA